MKVSNKGIVFLLFFALAGISYGEAREGDYFPPNNHGIILILVMTQV